MSEDQVVVCKGDPWLLALLRNSWLTPPNLRRELAGGTVAVFRK